MGIPTKSFKINPTNIEYLGINLTKEVKDLYAENYKTLFKKNKKDTYKSKDIPYTLIGRIHIVKMATVPIAICRVNAIP